MSNNPNVTVNPYLGESVTYIVTFEVVTSLISIIIIVTSGLVLCHIYSKVRKSRADFLFFILSISDIWIGWLTLMFMETYILCLHIKCRNIGVLPYPALFSLGFPYIFSCIVTTIVAVDRLFVVKKQCSYTNFITKRRLMCILVFFFATTIALCYWLAHVILTKAHSTAAYITYAAFNIALSITIIGAYIFILCFAFSHSKNASHCKSNGNRDFKRLTKTIMFIFVSQVICSFPFQIYWSAPNIPLPAQIFPWVLILRNASSLFNGIILLLGERRKRKNKIRISKETGFLKDLAKFPSP